MSTNAPGTLTDPFGARDTFDTGNGSAYLYRLDTLARQGYDIARLPFSIRVLLEGLLRECDGFRVTEDDVHRLAGYDPRNPAREEIPFMPARVLLQDFTGVPAVVDLAAMRSAMARLGGDPNTINPRVPVHLIIDHSVQVDHYGTHEALQLNAQIEFKRNRERYEFLRWGQQAFDNFFVVPPASGICHQVNLEYVARGVWTRPEADGLAVAYPDSLVGTDSHTTMINGLGVLGWGVGGIEAEAVMLGQPIYMLMPEVVGFRLSGELPEGATATDLVLTVTQMLRSYGVVGRFVEFFGPGLHTLTVPDRATIGNMAPEYGATMGFFPIDEMTLAYMRQTGRSEELITLVERYTKEQGLFHTPDTPDPEFLDVLELDLSTVVPSVAGPKRPQDRIQVPALKESFAASFTAPVGPKGFGRTPDDLKQTGRYVDAQGQEHELKHGDVCIAAITSCTNTSNPSVMIGAGLVAKKAVERGLTVPPYVKTSLAPGSRVVTQYLREAGLLPYLDQLGFNLVGYGCTTCIGNSGPLPEPVAKAIKDANLIVAGVLSGNRNFEGRIHPLVQANYLASPPLVVAYALAGTVDIDLMNDPIGQDSAGNDVFLKDIWPTAQEIKDLIAASITPEMYEQEYGGIETSNETWNNIKIPEGSIYAWDASSTYIQEPPFFVDLTPETPEIRPIRQARVLVKVGDSTTTDHISPAGAIPEDSPAGKYLLERGVKKFEFNSYGSRRGNHEVMMRGTFANIRIKNQLVPGTEGGITKNFLKGGEVMPIYDAAMDYIRNGVPLVVLGGKDYGMGSSRDWAAKGTALLGVRAVIVESFERIHRSNLIGMGVLPLQFKEGESAQSLGLDGTETYDVPVTNDVQPRQTLTVTATKSDGSTVTFDTVVRLDTPVEVEYYRHGGILHYVLRDFLSNQAVEA
ncbi:MAG: aconitate hydratase AcnA [Bacteroidetes bacterium]|nr:MAG: aconitate hydratase AcnA [Bacteroidota bacterium]